MCNLYRLHKGADAIRQLFADQGLQISFPEGIPNLQPTDIRITDPAPIVRMGRDGGLEMVVRRWSWPGPHGKPVFNLRSEGRSFSNRCLAIADGFYEFTAQTDPKVKRKHKWRFALRGAPLFAIAGLFRASPDVGEAFTMLTMPPGPDIAPYHNRQVAVLTPEDFAAWLDTSVPASEALKPLPVGSLEVEQIC